VVELGPPPVEPVKTNQRAAKRVLRQALLLNFDNFHFGTRLQFRRPLDDHNFARIESRFDLRKLVRDVTNLHILR
jgi:hypothetical protein